MGMTKEELDKKIDTARNTIRTDKLDITYGELATMYENKELKIAPDYQRLFRWDIAQKTRFIESILLGIPIPAIFVAEDAEGKWELVDGLQRVSTMLEFMGSLRDEKDQPCPPSRLEIPNPRMLLTGLDGFTFDDLSLRSRLSIKRASCRVEVIKVGSKANMKYEVFERLNTGGAVLSAQEVRNCIFRATDPAFMDWVDDLARYPSFASTLGLSEFQAQSMFDRGLVLRYFTMKNKFESFEHDVEPFITEYIRDVIEGNVKFDRSVEDALFKETFDIIARDMGEDAWRHFRDGKHRGPFSVYVFDVLSVSVARNVEYAKELSPDEFAKRCVAIKQHPDFVNNTGGGANIKSRTLARFAIGLKLMGGNDTGKKSGRQAGRKRRGE